MTENVPCACPVSGFCTRHDRVMGERLHSICQGTSGLSDEVTAKYRALFSTAQPVQPEQHQIIRRRPQKMADVIAAVAVPRNAWPTAAVLIATLRTPEDAGVGDTIKRLLGTAGTVYQAAFRAITGHSCTGCGFRQQKWNQLYPY